MKRININKLQAGDIILTASCTKTGKAVRFGTHGLVSHAMICVQYSSIIDSTSDGVQARNLQREFFSDGEEVYVFRLSDEQSPEVIAQIVDFARSEIGSRYSIPEAMRSVVSGRKPRNAKQFCSRLVARAYDSAGIQLVTDNDYCTPEELRKSPLLIELEDMLEEVDDAEVTMQKQFASPIEMTTDAQNAILNVARLFDPTIENFNDLDKFVQEHPERDSEIAQAYRASGYLDLWQHEFHNNPWRYDLSLMEIVSSLDEVAELRTYCIETIREAYSGGIRFAVNLVHYKTAHSQGERETLVLLINLYEKLVRNDQLRRETAALWLRHHYPADAMEYMERIEPHSEIWFVIVDRVEPQLGFLARQAIMNERSKEVCSSCGDEPALDYRIVNSAEAMPGVPSLRLCDDCSSIRRGFGEVLELIH